MADHTQSSNDMRRSAEWMVPSDDRILELIREHGNLTPRAIDNLGGPVKGHAGDRCRELMKYGLLHRIDRGLYGITDDGIDYLDEDLDAGELEPVEDVE